MTDDTVTGNFCFSIEEIPYDPDFDLFFESDKSKSQFNKFECDVCHKKYKTI